MDLRLNVTSVNARGATVCSLSSVYTAKKDEIATSLFRLVLRKFKILFVVEMNEENGSFT